MIQREYMIISNTLFRLTVIIRNKGKHDELFIYYLNSLSDSEINVLRSLDNLFMVHQ